MRRDGTLFGLVALAALVGALLLWDRHRPSTDEAARQQRHLLPSSPPEQVMSLEIERGPARIRLRRERSGWWLEGPRRRAADREVESLLAELQGGEVQRRVPLDDAKLVARLGLASPRALVRVAGHTLRIGVDAPGAGVYVQRDGERVALVAERRLAELATQVPERWHAMTLTLSDPRAAHRLEAGSWTLQRDGAWRVVRPAAIAADEAQVEALLQSLTRARAVREIAPPVGVTASGPTLSFDGVVQAQLAGECGPGEARVARADGAWLCFRERDLALVDTPATTFYQRQLFGLRLDELVAADLGPLHLRREAGIWRIVAPATAAGPARDEAVRARLEPLVTAAATGFSDGSVAGGLRIRLATREQSITATVKGGAARRAGDGVTLRLAHPLAISTEAASLRRAPAPGGG